MNFEYYEKELDTLSEYRRIHSLNVAKEAVRLAENTALIPRKPALPDCFTISLRKRRTIYS